MNPTRTARLLHQVLDGTLRQHKFAPAEIQLLLDLTSVSRVILRRYQKMVARRAANAESPPTLAEFLERQRQSSSTRRQP